MEVTPALAQGLADRHTGVGFDQLAMIKQTARRRILRFERRWIDLRGMWQCDPLHRPLSDG